MSKAFDRVWQDGLLFKLKQNGINGQLLNLLKRYLNNRKQRVFLNGTARIRTWTLTLFNIQLTPVFPDHALFGNHSYSDSISNPLEIYVYFIKEFTLFIRTRIIRKPVTSGRFFAVPTRIFTPFIKNCSNLCTSEMLKNSNYCCF